MKDKIFLIVFLSICCIVCFGIASILNLNLSIIQNKEYFEQSGFVLKQLNHIIKSPTILMIIQFILSVILASIVEPQLYGGMITTQFTVIEIFVNLQIIGMYIIAKEKLQIVGLILFTLSIIFVVSLIFNIACSLPREKDEQTYHLIHRSYDTMMWLFLLEIFIFFILGLHSIYGKIIAKDKLITNKIEQKTLPLANKSIKSETKTIDDKAKQKTLPLTNEPAKPEIKPIEDNVINHKNNNIKQAVRNRDLAQNIANMRAKMASFP